ncbi:hypothetical protein [Mycolicibacterium iranicum]|uniref:hypothetical protein n=1 Tax=Mycolicibacterium iranicum TaxID=912594 RepID=UPI0004661D43|nr:hypothetical protein [Mycolicibacterium iranicum]
MVIVFTVVATLLVTRSSEQASPPSASETPSAPLSASDVASATDKGPIKLITDDPTCASWKSVTDALAAEATKGWDQRDTTIPAAHWTPAQRQQHTDMAAAMRSAAEQTIALIKLTPHRVMRELYEQSVAYWTQYADQVPNYVPADDHLARVATGTTNSLLWICSSIEFGVAQSRAPFVVPAPAPNDIPAPQDPAQPQRFMPSASKICDEWMTEQDRYGKATEEWFNTDPAIPGTQWTPEQQAIYTDMTSIMQANADQLQNLGMQSANVVFDDFAALAAQYRRAYVQSFTTYVPEDTYLANAATELVVVNTQACLAAESS